MSKIEFATLPKMKVTVILCTYNRCQKLPKVLNDLAGQILPDSIEWEVVLVDNNSNDQTKDVAGEFCARHSDRFRYVFEPQAGLSRARNTGIREASGDVLVFTDDDVSIGPTWLATMAAAFEEREWSGAGGRVLPEWNSPPPKWLPRNGLYSLAALVVFDLGEKPGQLTETPFGANMSYRKEMFEKYGGFRTDLGHIGTKLTGHEDSEFGHRLMAAGERLRYVPEAIVQHPVTPERLQKKYFLKYRFDAGRGDIRQLGIPPETKYFLCGIPLYLFRRLAVWTARWMASLQPHRRFEYKVKVWGISGQIAECYQSPRKSKTTVSDLV